MALFASPGNRTLNTDHIKTERSRSQKPTIDLARRLWSPYVSRYWPRLLVALMAMGVYAASAAALPLAVEWIDSGFAGGAERFAPTLNQVLVFGPIFIALAVGLNALAQYIQVRATIGAALCALRDMQNEMFSSLTAMDLAQQRADTSGQIIARFTNDTAVLRETLSRISNGVRDVFTLLALCATMLFYDWALFLVVLAIYPVIGLPVARIGKILRKTSADAQRQAGDVMSLVSESVSGSQMVKSYQIEPLEQARAAFAFDTRLSLLKRMAYARALNEPFINLAGAIALGAVVAIVAIRISNGAIDRSEFSGFLVALLLLSQPARGLGTLNAVMQEGFGAFERILGLIDSTGSISSAANAKPLSVGGGAIRFENVSFQYDGNAKALHDVSFDIEEGSRVAIVGPSGAGKSTLINLLPRLYDPTAGRIMIDGVDISLATISSVRSVISLVSQDAIVFNLSAMENIAFGKPGSTRADIIRAASDAAANDFIAVLEDGYDTPLGENGGVLSGGQRQRIALARAFLKNAPILLLDEATSALDAENEDAIHEALNRITAGRTSLIIAHRLSTVKDADRIIVLDEGQIVEQGTHTELLENDGVYARHVQLQLR